MKKITKRIMALMLSLVMILGCIPSFINEASANELITIEKVNIFSSGWLARNVNTLQYNVANDAPYTLTDGPNENWYEEDLETPHDSVITSYKAEVYKKLVIKSKSGYKFTSDTVVNLDATGQIYKTELIDDETLTIFIETTIQRPTISLDFEKPETYTELKYLETNLQNGHDKFIFAGEDLDAFKSYRWYDEVANNNNNYRGYFLLESKYLFSDKDTCESIIHIFYRNKYLTFEEINSEIDSAHFENYADIMNMKTNDILCYKLIDDTNSKYTIYIYEKLDLRKSPSITIPTAEGTTIQDLIDSATITDSAGTASLLSSGGNKNIKVFSLEDGQIKGQLQSDDLLEKDKEYFVSITVYDTEWPANSSVKLNGTQINTLSSNDVTNRVQVNTNNLIVCYILSLKQPAPSSGSKKYKANDKDTAEKISGSGKKGSTRTITPIEGKKVSSVIVTDKDGTKVDVTLNEDGTYSFKQPASDVTIEVNYKNREITLNIGSTEASVDGEKSNLDVCPVTRNDRTMLPIRFIAENLGAKVEWNENKTDYVAITRGDTKIEITLGSDIMLVNGKEVKLDSVAFAENDRTYLPVRAISEALNAIVEWNEERPMEVKIYER